MSEVSGRATAFLVEALERRGVDPARLVEGTPFDVETLRDTHHRMDWDDYAPICMRFEALAGGPDEMEQVGLELTTSPGWAIGVGFVRLFLDPRKVIEVIHRHLGVLQFSVVASELEEISPNHLRLILRIPSDRLDCPAFFRISRGGLAAYTALTRAPAPAVALTIRPREATYDIVFPPHRPGPLGRLRRLVRIARADGALVDLASEYRDLYAALQQVTEAKHALEASEARWRAVVQSAPETVLMLDRDGVIQFVNRDDTSLRGGRIIGLRVLDLTRPEDLPEVRAAFDDVFSGTPRAIDFRWTDPGGVDRVYRCHMGPIVTSGVVTGATVVAHDVTDERRAITERAALEAQLQRAQKRESLGSLAGGVAHDFNNLLTVVLANADLARHALGKGDVDKASRTLQRVESAARRAASLTRQMLAYAGRESADLVPVALSDVTGEVEVLVDALVPPGVRISWDVPADLPLVRADAGQLQQVILNLVSNALEARVAPDARVSVTARAAHLATAQRTDDDRRLPAGDYVALEVADTGRGIAPDAVEQIFDPFFSTKGTGRGLGLSSTQGIVRAHGGGLSVRTSPGVGTTFRILLRAAPDIDAVAVDDAEPAPLPDQVTVLVIDDDPAVRETACAALEARGVSTLAASDGAEGLRLHAERGGSVDVVLLDLVMPGLSGAEVYDRLRTRDPGLPVVLTTGYDREADLADLRQRGAIVLRKPWSPDDLVRTLRIAVGRPAGG